jgi:hypothetical protein
MERDIFKSLSSKNLLAPGLWSEQAQLNSSKKRRAVGKR